MTYPGNIMFESQKEQHLVYACLYAQAGLDVHHL